MKFQKYKRYNPAKRAGYDAIEIVFDDDEKNVVYVIPGAVFEKLLETTRDITPSSIKNLMKTEPSTSSLEDMVMYMYKEEIVDSSPTKSFFVELIQEKLDFLAKSNKSIGSEVGLDKSLESLTVSDCKKILSELERPIIRQIIDANRKRLQEESEQKDDKITYIN